MKDEPSLARNGAAAAISRGSPQRPMGYGITSSGTAPLLSGVLPAMPVKMNPGRIELIRMLSLALSRFRQRGDGDSDFLMFYCPSSRSRPARFRSGRASCSQGSESATSPGHERAGTLGRMSGHFGPPYA
jgi:hypothetical protein